MVVIDDDDSSSSEEEMTLADMVSRMKKNDKSTCEKSNGKDVKTIDPEESSSSSEEDGMTLADLMRSSKKAVQEAEEESSSEEEISLADLKVKIEKANERKKKRTSKSKNPRLPAKRRKVSKNRKSPVKVSAGPKFVLRTGARRISRATDVLQKPQLIDAVLVRWNYCMEWPVLKNGYKKAPEKLGYVELRGFPGVLVGVDGDHTGKVIDYRDLSKAPTFDNLSKKDSAVLQSMAETAILKQIEILRAADASQNAVLIKNLQTELADIKKVSATRSDREWAKHGW